MTACGGGISEGEFEAERKLDRELGAEVQALQQRLDRGAAITEVLDTLTSGFEAEISVQAILGLTALIQVSGSPELRAKWVEIIESVQASSDPAPRGAFIAMADVIEALRETQLAAKWGEIMVTAALGNEGGTLFLEFAALVQASGVPALLTALPEFFEAVTEGRQPPRQLLAEFVALAEASGNTRIEEAFNRLGEPSPEVIEEVRLKLKAIGAPSLEALFEAAHQSTGREFGAFSRAMLAVLRETLQ